MYPKGSGVKVYIRPLQAHSLAHPEISREGENVQALEPLTLGGFLNIPGRVVALPSVELFMALLVLAFVIRPDHGF